MSKFLDYTGLQHYQEKVGLETHAVLDDGENITLTWKDGYYIAKANGNEVASSSRCYTSIEGSSGHIYRVITTRQGGALISFVSLWKNGSFVRSLVDGEGTDAIVVDLQILKTNEWDTIKVCTSLTYKGAASVSQIAAFNLQGVYNNLDEKIGRGHYAAEHTASGTFDVSSFTSRLSLTNLPIKQGDIVKLTIEGTSERTTQRIYLNRSGGTQITIPGTGNVIMEFVAQIDISALYFSSAVTTAGTIEMGLSYEVEATGLRKSEEIFNEVLPNIEDIVGVVKDNTTVEHPTWSLGASNNRIIYQTVTKNDDCSISCKLTNVVGSYMLARLKYGTGTTDYINLKQITETSYYGEINLAGIKAGTTLSVYLFTDSTHTGSNVGECDLQIKEQSRTGKALLRVDIYNSDTQLEIYEKMLWANNVGYCDVHFQPGTYYFDETLYDYLWNEKGLEIVELPIGGHCKYHFNGATLIGSYAGSNTTLHENCNVIGCRLTSGNFELFDGTIIANDIVYAIHDDVGDNAGDSHVHKYSNMHIIYNGGTMAENHQICKCIGGGTGKNLTVVIDKCILEKYTENPDMACVTYHGISSNPSSPTKTRIMITNTWMNGSCRVYHIVTSGRNETIEFIVSNCHARIGENDVDSFFAWNNETPTV